MSVSPTSVFQRRPARTLIQHAAASELHLVCDVVRMSGRIQRKVESCESYRETRGEVDEVASMVVVVALGRWSSRRSSGSSERAAAPNGGGPTSIRSRVRL